MKNIVSDFLKKLWVVLSEALVLFRKNNDLTLASSLAFSATLALIPALFLLTFVLGVAVGSSQEALVRTQEFLTQLIPTYSDEILREVRVITTYKTTIGAVNIVILLWIITPLVSELRLALSTVFRTKARRPFLLEKLLDVAITVVFLLGLSAIAALGVLFALSDRGQHFRFLPGYLDGALPSLIVIAVVFILYYTFSPSMRLRHLVVGALAASGLWLLLRPAFSLFLTYNPGYGVAFGSFKSIFVVIIWIYYSFAVFLFGAEIAASLRRKETAFIRRLMEGRRSVPGRVLSKFVIRYEKGSAIFIEGDAGGEMYSIRSGSAAIWKGDREIAVIREGEFFGEMSFLLGVPRTASAVALEDVELIIINDQTVKDLIDEFPDFILKMLKEMASRLREMNRIVDKEQEEPVDGQPGKRHC
ncbi:MAG: hypothetical protein A2X56_09630 [Nitrospirae bacterium GWC2_57_13]|jgi:membrane protein|nr:MAG: hypothetical protein A2072_04190 [Nitrospirae bacterium GWC1_57_7]OGW27418.1 MAG: hypothetical protein A2X56_09630 [Nitrospirae bacterium GWC2_57_13]OGW41827.1 MAG: hypothetical protein A2X57_00250 [Nitrospirae bacterium GWD2_57_8]HAR46126.1 hypothetical protein [Nitrospiraceae bacterium]